MRTKVGWGILGTGTIAAEFATALQSIPGARIAAVASRSLDRAQDFARAVGAARPHGDWTGLVGDPDVDVVYVATENSTHKEASLACLGAGKAVVCEKPFTVNAVEARAVVAEARRRHVFCMEAMWMRFVPLFRELIDVVHSGAIGDVRMVSAQLGFPCEHDPKHRVFDPALGGGALLDLGVYTVSFALALLGRPTRIATHAVLGQTGVDEQVAAILGFSEGRQAVLATSIRHRTSNDATIMGTAGIVRVREPLYCPPSLTIVGTPTVGRGSGSLRRGRLASLKRLPLVKGLGALVARARARTITRRADGNGLQYQAMEVMRCLRAGELESPIMPLDESVAVMETLDEIRRSWKIS